MTLPTIHIHQSFIDEAKYLASIGKELAEDYTKELHESCTRELSERQKDILELIRFGADISLPEIALKLSVGIRTIKTDVKELQNAGSLYREGGRKEGKWIIKTEDNEK